MSERHLDLGELSPIATAALNAYARWAKFTPTQKQEILLMCQVMANIEVAREQRMTAAFQRPQQVTDE